MALLLRLYRLLSREFEGSVETEVSLLVDHRIAVVRTRLVISWRQDDRTEKHRPAPECAQQFALYLDALDPDSVCRNFDSRDDFGELESHRGAHRGIDMYELRLAEEVSGRAV